MLWWCQQLKTQSPALVCDRAAAGSDPVHTCLPPISGRSENTFHVRIQRPAREPPNLLHLSRGKQLSKRRGDCTASCSHHFQRCTIQRSAFPKSGSATPTFVGGLGPLYFLSGSKTLREMSVRSTLLFTEFQQYFCGCFVVLSYSHRSRLKIWTVALHCKSALESISPAWLSSSFAYQRDGVFVPVPLVLGCAAGDVDRREAVQVTAVVFCPLLSWRLLLSNGLVAIENLGFPLERSTRAR